MRTFSPHVGYALVALLLHGCTTTADFETAEIIHCARQLNACSNELAGARNATGMQGDLPAAEPGDCYALVDVLADGSRTWEQVACSLPAEHVREVQGTLKALGLYAGDIDGRLGPQTVSALERYSEQRGLPMPASAVSLRALRALQVGFDPLVRPPPVQSVQNAGAIRASVQAALEVHADEDDLYIGDMIPRDKLQNAQIASGAPRDEETLGLLNMTVFGSARKAVLFGIKGLYISGETGAAFLRYEDLPDIGVIRDGPHYVLFSNGIRLNFAGSSFNSSEFTALLGDLNGRLATTFGGSTP